MNFISGLEAKDIQMELKYCERCGGLWLRLQGGEGVYCPGCCEWLATLPAPKGRRKVRPRTGPGEELRGEELHGEDLQGEELHTHIQIGSLQGVAEMEVEG